VKYLTPTFYRASGEGVPLSGVTDLALARFIARAESDIDQYCHLVSLAPHTIEDEVREWNPASRRYYYGESPMPVSAISRFLIQISTNAQTGDDLAANVSPNDIVINAQEGWFEVVSMTTLTMGLTPVLLNLGLSTTLAHVDYTCGFTYAIDDEPLFSADNLTYASARCLWDAAVTPTVKKNGVTVESGYTVDFTEGIVTFASANQPSDQITASYTHHVPDTVRDAAIEIVSARLGERGLQQAGLTGLQEARAGRYYQAQRATGSSAYVLPDEIKRKLTPFRHMAMGGG